MKIAFLLPMPTTKIVGGYKVVYEYANYLAAQNNDVSIFFDSNRGKNSKGLPKRMVYLLRCLICKREPRWYDLSSKIKKINVFSLNREIFESYDVVVATAAETAVFVNSLSVKKKIYLIQDFEKNWQLDEKQLFETYNYPNMKLVVVSKWLVKKVSEHTKKKVYYIPNGIDKSIFYNYEKNRNNHSIAMLYHLDERKASNVGLKVIFKLKQKYPDLEAYLFGTPKRDRNWPKWIHYTRSATPEKVAEIMNKAKIFLCTSRFEGFGLTGLESMFCGCVLVTTDCGGVRNYASERNSLICDIDNVKQLETSVIRLFKSKRLRIKLKENFKNEKNKFYLNRSCEEFSKLID
ncbi:glycosyltransferase family 4 protein [Limosilactobacillus panis]|uniref:Glycosyltransferase n=1 Tax=Limosilactobacillus panis DSM 6035 TaxID=1423782 RepID=A0A0R1XG00_9LACO|nr:glycosyltransferase family 4 protein [Limosilactobacillus panis]KRM29063.1 glycosyltransferase [Limosilactobacillus panis DSM 6035]